MDSRVVKTKTPFRFVVAAAVVGLLVLGFVFLAILESGTSIREARMSGIVVGKEFVPSSEPEFQVTLGREGSVNAQRVVGEHILTVEVRQADGTQKPYKVWLDQGRYDSINIGDRFDVGPYLVK